MQHQHSNGLTLPPVPINRKDRTRQGVVLINSNNIRCIKPLLITRGETQVSQPAWTEIITDDQRSEKTNTQKYIKIYKKRIKIETIKEQLNYVVYINKLTVQYWVSEVTQ